MCYSAILQNFSNVNFNWFWGYGKTRKDFIKRMRYLEVKPKMPAIMNYNNTLYGVAGEAVAKFVCVPYDRLVRNI